MVLRNKIFQACESLLRVPPLLVIDEIFRHNFGLGDKWVLSDSDSGIIWSEDSTEAVIEEVPLPLYVPPFVSSLIQGVTSISGIFGSLLNSASIDDSSGSAPLEDPVHYMRLEIEGFDAAQTVLGDIFKVLKVLFLLQVCAAALVCFVLSTKNLVKLYSYLLAFSSVYLSWYVKPLMVTTLCWATTRRLLLNIAVRGFLAATYFVSRMWPGGYPYCPHSAISAAILNVMDALMFSLFFVSGVVAIPEFMFFSIVILLQGSLWVGVPKLYHFLCASWEDTKRVRNDYGISHLIQRETGRLRINVVFRLFWLSRALFDLFVNLPNHSLSNTLRLVTTNGTETLLGIIGLTLTVSGLAHQIGAFLMWILYRGTNSEADVNRFGSITTILFFILCLQTSLTSLMPDKRLDRLMKNMVLLSTALLHAVHQMVAPLLHAFRSFRALQIRAAVLSVVFLVGSFWCCIVLLYSSEISTWSMAVLALALEFKIKIIVSLLVSLFVYFAQRVDTPIVVHRIRMSLRALVPDALAHFVTTFGDQLDNDNIIFYLKAFSQSAEFVTGIFLLGNAVWIFLFESASAIRALGMAIHAYFNIWLEGKKGWRVYVQRRSASRKIDSLSDATAEQLERRRDDVCAICYEEMDSAKVTLCGHLFHAACLRKWLYIQNTCPLCHEILYAEEGVEHHEGDDLVPPVDNNRNNDGNNRNERRNRPAAVANRHLDDTTDESDSDSDLDVQQSSQRLGYTDRSHLPVIYTSADGFDDIEQELQYYEARTASPIFLSTQRRGQGTSQGQGSSQGRGSSQLTSRNASTINRGPIDSVVATQHARDADLR